MKSFLTKIILFVSIITTGVSAQNLKKESVNNNTYYLDIELYSTPYKIVKKSSKNLIHFNNFLDETKPGTPVLPAKDLFIAIPPRSNPNIIVSLIDKKEINAEPELNPLIQRESDSSIVYIESHSPVISPINELFKVNGFLWIGNNYCVHLTIYQYQYDYEKRVIIENNMIHLDLTFNKPINNLDNENNFVNEIILNKKFASGIQSVPDYQIEQTDDWINYDDDYVKIGVAKDGVYRIEYNDLLSLGVLINEINPMTLKLFKRGGLIPIYVNGESDGSFDQGDFVEFAGIRNMGDNYREVSTSGKPYNEYLGRYTDTTIYWLTWGGDFGQRVSLSNGNPSIIASDTLKFYNELIHKEVNNWFDFSMADQVKREMPFWTENKTWNEGNLGVGTLNVTFNLSDVYPEANTKMFVKLQDYASDISIRAHLLALSINEYPALYDSGYINKYEQKVLSGDFNSSLLVQGVNTLKVHSFQTTATLNACIRDWYEIEYPRYIKALNDSLSFSFNYLSSPGLYCFYLNNIQSNAITFWKFGNSFNKYFVTAISGSVFIKDTINATNKFFICDSGSVIKPKLYYKKKFVNLRSNQNKADYLAITNKALLNKGGEYINFIQGNYNIETKLIDVADIYDEFAYGYFNPESIRDFLINTHTAWQSPSPEYVFLIGDANYDYHFNKFIYLNTPPIENIVASFGAPVSDNWFVTWDTTGAYVPQMRIGRIPVHSEMELENYLQVHARYLEQPFDGWNKSYIFFSGGKDNQNELDTLKGTNQYIIDNYVIPSPIGGNWSHFYKTMNPITNFGPYSNEYYQNAIDRGGLFISYLGHSGTQTWDNSISDPSQLHNLSNRNPLITDFGCSTAKFAEPDVVSFSELFINSNQGQAISYIGNSSLGFLSTATSFPGIFYRKILRDSIVNVSKAHQLAKLEMLQNFGSSGTIRLFALTNELIGDPIISLPIPQKPNLVINESDISINTGLTDLEENAKILLTFYNWGKTVADSFLITVQDNYLGGIIYTDSIYKKVPLYQDSLKELILVLNKPGEHKILFTFDANNNIGEINESDNTIIFKFYVASSRIKTLLVYANENGINDSITILNPAIKSLSDSIDIELSHDKDYLNSSHLIVKMDTVTTKFKLPAEFLNKRIWLRGKLKGEEFYGFDKSAYTGISSYYFLNDAISLSNSRLLNLSLHNNVITLDTNKINFHIISAGFNDGNTAVILKNGENFVLDNTLRGHHLCVFKDSSYDFVQYKHFDLLAGGATTALSYINFLDSLNDNELVMIAISDEGYSFLSNDLKSKIREFGSIYIDSLVGRSSWAFIGKRGALPGSMPEAYKNPFDGRVEIDTLIQKLFKSGNLTTSKIGPASKWRSVNINQSVPPSADTKIRAIGIKQDGTLDTLGYLSIRNGVADLSNINASAYKNLRLLTVMEANNESQLPSISFIGVNYNGLPELVTNYQVVSIENDTIPAGGNITLSFWVYNVGEANADSFDVTVDVINQNNNSSTVFNQLVTSLSANSKKKFEVSYQASGTDTEKRFLINIDPDQKVSEYFKDNNYYARSFYVEPDLISPTVKITFDEAEVVNGDFVSKNPNIKIALSDESLIPIVDTTALKIYLNEEPVHYSGNSSILSYNINSTNPKFVADYKPKLDDGVYLLRIVGKDPNGNTADSTSSQVYFVVSSETKLMEVYNYPNPFANETYFTFRLSQIPEEVKIRIYTIAGRMIKEIVSKSSELNYDLNKIYWNGKDEDGDVVANGTYLYKMLMKSNDKVESVTQKLVIVK